MARAHVRRDELCHGEGREEIQLHEVAGFLHGHFPGGLIDAHAGVVDEDIDGAEALEGALDDAAANLLVGDVAGDDQRIGRGGRRNPSSLRAVRESLAPEVANSRAQAAPIPSEAPVMSTTLPSIRMGNVSAQGCLWSAESS